MAIYKNSTGLWLYKGDTGNITFSGLPTDKAYTCYFSVYDEDNERIVKEITATSFNQVEGVATFTINEDTSNSLPVGDYTYALKICASGEEDTVIPETTLEDEEYVQQPAPSITVLPKRIEGD